MTSLSVDAMIFGLGHFRTPKSTLRFGGEGAQMEITPRARAALDELLAAGYAEQAGPDCRTPGREHFKGTDIDPPLALVAKESGLDPLSDDHRWTTFSKIEAKVDPLSEEGRLKNSAKIEVTFEPNM